MKLSEIKGEQALDAIADIIDPVMEIISDERVEDAYKSGQKIKAVKVMVKEHKKSVLNILAILDGEDPNTYEPNVLTLPRKILEVLNDPEINSLFPSQDQTMEKTSSGPAMVNTEADETI